MQKAERKPSATITFGNRAEHKPLSHPHIQALVTRGFDADVIQRLVPQGDITEIARGVSEFQAAQTKADTGKKVITPGIAAPLPEDGDPNLKKLATQLIAENFIPVDPSSYHKLISMHTTKRPLVDLPRSPEKRIIEEAFLIASEAELQNDKTLMNRYFELGEEIDPDFFLENNKLAEQILEGQRFVRSNLPPHLPTDQAERVIVMVTDPESGFTQAALLKGEVIAELPHPQDEK